MLRMFGFWFKCWLDKKYVLNFIFYVNCLIDMCMFVVVWEGEF